MEDVAEGVFPTEGISTIGDEVEGAVAIGLCTEVAPVVVVVVAG